MTMSLRKKRRIRLIGFAALLLVFAAIAIGYGFRDSIEFFRSPTQIVQDGAPNGQFRLGGLVLEDSIAQTGDVVEFTLTDRANDVPVTYRGLLPDLFDEGQGAIARGQLNADGVFVANEILAKHDENYLPREVADALKEQGIFQPDE